MTGRSWELYAGRDDHNGGFRDVGVPMYVKAYGHEEVVPVTLIENPEGRYYGWLGFAEGDWHKADEHPVMIQSHEGIFGMQFPYGYQAEVDRNRGEVVRMDIVERIAE